MASFDTISSVVWIDFSRILITAISYVSPLEEMKFKILLHQMLKSTMITMVLLLGNDAPSKVF